MSEKEDETFDLCSSSAMLAPLRFPLCMFPQRQLAAQVAAGLTLARQQGSFRSAVSLPFWVSGAHLLGFQNLHGTMQDFTVHYGSYQSHAAVEI